MNIDNQIKEFESFLETLNLHRRLINYREVEMDLLQELNPVNDFEEYFYINKQYIKFEDFFIVYITRHKEHILKKFPNFNSNKFAFSFQARIYRTYMGLITEYHAFLIAQKVFGIENVIRNKEADKMGVDFIIKYRNINYNVHIFIDSEEAWNKRKFKSKKKHAEQLEGYHVNFPYTLVEGRFNSVKKLKNGIGIYTLKYFNFLKSKMDEGKILNNNIIGTGITDFIYSNQ